MLLVLRLLFSLPLLLAAPPPSLLSQTAQINFTTPILTPIACYSPSPYLLSAKPSDCHSALFDILLGSNVLDVIVWDARSRLPTRTVSGSCSIIFTRSRPAAKAMFQPAFVAHAAALIIRQCVVQETLWQGGQARLDEGEFMVYVSASADQFETAVGGGQNGTGDVGLKMMRVGNSTLGES